MPRIDLVETKRLLDDFDFRQLFTEQLGWSQPNRAKLAPVVAAGTTATLQPISQLGGVAVLEVMTGDGIPDAKARRAFHTEVSRLHHENLLIFVDRDRTQSLWLWAKRENGKSVPREHLYVRGQTGDLFLAKLAGMMVDFGDFDAEGNIDVLTVSNRLRDSLDVEGVTKKFYREFQAQHLEFVELIGGIDDERDRRWYASVLLNRLMFIYFLQKKFFLDGGNERYLQDKLAASRTRGPERFYSEFLKTLFFEGFARPADQRSPEATALIGKIRYLNGGLFLPHRIELENAGKIQIPDAAFENLLSLFGRYDWHLDDTPAGNPNEINPDVLGYIFEKYINQKAFGAYYTRPEITEYLCEQTIHRLILQRAHESGAAPQHFESLAELLLHLDVPLCRELLDEVLPNLALLDPACGSGAFLVAAMRTLIDVYSAVTGRIEYLGDAKLNEWLATQRREHASLNYFIKKRIIADNLFGVDLMEEATEIARLRLFLALVASVQSADQLEPLPNIDFNIIPGNSLIGLLRVDPERYRSTLQGGLFDSAYSELVKKKERLVKAYRHHSATEAEGSAGLQDLRDAIDAERNEAISHLNAILLDDLGKAGISFEQATWDAAKNKEGRSKRRSLTMADMRALHPFHWGYEFSAVMEGHGGFDAIITNPPWDIFKPNAKEFFEEYSDVVSKNTMTVAEFEKEQAKLLGNPDLREAWLGYLSRFPHQNLWFRSAPQFAANQVAPVVNGKRANIGLNLFKLFTEQCFNLLRPGGECGIVIPSGIYTDLGCMGLRELLFSHTTISGLFGFENRKAIFEGVDSRFKFVVLTFEKGSTTERFPAAFMRHDAQELRAFPRQGSIEIGVELVRRLSPDSLSIPEFKHELDLQIAERLQRFPTLGERLDNAWNLRLNREFNMTDDSDLFLSAPGVGRLPLFEGKMIWQFEHAYGDPRYWIEEREGRKRLEAWRLNKINRLLKMSGMEEDVRAGDLELDYDHYRVAFRDVAASTNERTMIATVLPPKVFCPHTMTLEVVYRDEIRDRELDLNRTGMSDRDRLLVVALLNSFVVDSVLRQSVTNHLSAFFVYNLKVPRVTQRDPAFGAIVDRAARLVCTAPEYDELAAEVGLGSHAAGATDPAERARLRAELDGLVAHLYGLTEEEFTHILSTFPLVAEEVKGAALAAYRADI
jgi:hypothetical protein